MLHQHDGPARDLTLRENVLALLLSADLMHFQMSLLCDVCVQVRLHVMCMCHVNAPVHVSIHMFLHICMMICTRVHV